LVELGFIGSPLFSRLWVRYHFILKMDNTNVNAWLTYMKVHFRIIFLRARSSYLSLSFILNYIFRLIWEIVKSNKLTLKTKAKNRNFFSNMIYFYKKINAMITINGNIGITVKPELTTTSE